MPIRLIDLSDTRRTLDVFQESRRRFESMQSPGTPPQEEAFERAGAFEYRLSQYQAQMQDEPQHIREKA